MSAGRPTDYRVEYIEQVKKLCLLGATDVELADFFGIAVSTLNLWKNRHPEFMEALKSGKRHCDDKVVDALYNKAIGYELQEVREEESETSGRKTTVTKRQIAGDTTAQIFWLKNRQPEMWRDKQEHAVTLSDDFESLLDDANN